MDFLGEGACPFTTFRLTCLINGRSISKNLTARCFNLTF